MAISTNFVRILFMLLSVICMIAFAARIQIHPGLNDYLFGTILGLIIGGVVLGLDLMFHRFTLRSFNAVILGLFIGYLMALALLLILDTILEIFPIQTHHAFIEMIRIFIFLFGSYFGVIMTLRASNQLYLTIPFIKLTPAKSHIKHILLDISALCDPRIIDLAASGLLDKQLIIPHFVLKELHHQEEGNDPDASIRAKRALEVIKQLERKTELGLSYHQTDFPEVQDLTDKVFRLARLLDANILSLDLNRTQSQDTTVKVINIHSLINGLKPLMQKGEEMKVKIQRQGKENLQGVGYCEDGTMVVVNGGGEHMGEIVTAHVLSVKHTSSGRMIFCNIIENKNHDAENLS
ncbi:MAG: TRAM domain-containing protein [Chlamydiales bacterium]